MAPVPSGDESDNGAKRRRTDAACAKDSAGVYRVVHDNTFVGSAADVLKADVAKLSIGTVVSVLEVFTLESAKRVRARIQEPAGWISLLNIESGKRWAERQPQDDQPRKPAACAPPSDTDDKDTDDKKQDTVAQDERPRASALRPKRAAQNRSFEPVRDVAEKQVSSLRPKRAARSSERPLETEKQQDDPEQNTRERSQSFVETREVDEASGQDDPAQNMRQGARASSRRDSPEPAREVGMVRWYNGRRQSGVISDSCGSEVLIPVGGALNGNVCPPNPAGLMHGTNVSFVRSKDNALQFANVKGGQFCSDVKPQDEANALQLGLLCGVDSQVGGRQVNEDRVFATDLADLGFLSAVLDGHQGDACVEYVMKHLPQAVHNQYSALAERVPGGLASLPVNQEDGLICGALRRAFRAVDKDWLDVARPQKEHAGTAAVVVLLAHGFEAASSRSTVAGVPGGIAKLFVAWCGDCRAILLRGHEVVRLSEDHKPKNPAEMKRIQEAGGEVVKAKNNVYRAGRTRGRHEQWSAMSRSFGDITLKEPTEILTVQPDVKVVGLTTEDWAVVLACDGVFDVMTDADVGATCWAAMGGRPGGPVEAAKAVCQVASAKGSQDNLTAFVMRLGWASPPARR